MQILTLWLAILFILPEAHAHRIEPPKNGRIVQSTTDLPWFWRNYDLQSGTSDFSMNKFDLITQGRSGNQFVLDLRLTNAVERFEDVSYLEDGGTLIEASQVIEEEWVSYYYITKNSLGEIVSVFIEGEDGGKLPPYSKVRNTDDWLCFFKGLRSGTCASGDDT